MEQTPERKPVDRRGRKSAAAFRTISEVATDLNLQQHVLRFWETKFPQIKPLKRGGGRRYYRPEDVVFLRHIRSLLYDDGYTIKGVQKLLRQNGNKGLDAAAAETAPNESPGNMELNGPQRAELEAVLGELVALRDLLRGPRG
jgi:DNA-binding transcriptional MerR regulator